MSYIKFENLNKFFGDNHVLKDINIEVEKGSLVTLLGPSGCGKSTLLRCLAGLENVTSGKVYIEDKDITDVPPKSRGIGMVFQQYSLFPNMTVFQNVSFGLKMMKLQKEEVKERTETILKVVGLKDRANYYPSQLSGGQQQRVALARAIVTEPKVLLLDEPLSAIDAKLRRNLQVEIRRIQQEFGMTTIFVTHDQDEAMVMSDVITLMNEGYIEQLATPIQLYTKPVSKYAAEFMGSYNIFTNKEFEKLTGYAIDSENIAIRPEVLRINLPRDKENRFHLSGRIVDSISFGNHIRYKVKSDEIFINVDIMFDESTLVDIGTDIELSVRKTNTVMLER